MEPRDRGQYISTVHRCVRVATKVLALVRRERGRGGRGGRGDRGGGAYPIPKFFTFVSRLTVVDVASRRRGRGGGGAFYHYTFRGVTVTIAFNPYVYSESFVDKNSYSSIDSSRYIINKKIKKQFRGYHSDFVNNMLSSGGGGYEWCFYIHILEVGMFLALSLWVEAVAGGRSLCVPLCLSVCLSV